MGRTIDQSVPDWSMIPGPQAPEDAPNVLVVLIDDAGFGNPDTFGGPIATPEPDPGAADGADLQPVPRDRGVLTDPRRAADRPQPPPGRVRLDRRVPRPVPRVHRGRGPGPARRCRASCARTATSPAGSASGTSPRTTSRARPGRSTTGRSRGDSTTGGASCPERPASTTRSSPRTTRRWACMEGKDGQPYYFPDDLTDKAVEWLHGVRAQDATKPWFMYYSTGCAHAPHHVARAWADKYRGRFDEGWDKLREQTLERQKRLGIVPADTELTKRPDLFPAWDSLTDAEKKLYARQMEVFAGYSRERRLERRPAAGRHRGDGRPRQHAHLLHLGRQRLQHGGHGHRLVQRDDVPQRRGARTRAAAAGSSTSTAASRPWAAITPRRTTPPPGRTPATPRSSGASRCPATSAAPGTRWWSPGRSGSTPSGELRTQFTHCIDVAPTSWRPSACPSRTRWTGSGRSRWTAPASWTPSATRRPRSGTPCSTSRCSAAGPCTPTAGGRARSWTSAPWDFSPQTLRRFAPGVYDPEQDVWELYYLPDDFSQAHDLAAQHPDKLAELKELWWAEAERNRVLPLLGGMSVLFGILPPLPTVTRFTFAGDVQNVQRGMVPRILGRSYAIEAELHRARRRRRGRHRGQRRLHRRVRAVGRRRRPAAPHLLVPGRGDLQAGVHRADPDRRRDGEDAVRRGRGQAGHRRHGDAVGERQADRRGQDAAHGADRLLQLRGHGHRPRQRPGRRPRLRGQGPLRLHRHRARRSSSTSSRPPTRTRRRCTSTRRCRRSARAPPAEAGEAPRSRSRWRGLRSHSPAGGVHTSDRDISAEGA